MKWKRLNLIILACICIVFVLTACQPTPEEKIVVGKNDGSQEVIYETASGSQSFDYPESWQETFSSEDDKVVIDINANLEVPDVDAFPVVNVAPADISNEDMKELVRYFFEGPVYDSTDKRTRAEIQEEILELKADMQSLQQNGTVHNTSHIFSEEEIPQRLEAIERLISQLEAKLENAPEAIERSPSNIEFTENEAGDRDCSFVDTSSGDYNKIMGAHFYEDNKSGFVYYKRYTGEEYTVESELLNTKLNGVDMEPEEAEGLAKQMLKDIGFDDVITVGRYIAGYDGIHDTLSPVTASPQCYVFYFSQSIKGIPVTYFYGYEGTSGFDEYTFPWSPEVIEVDVDDNGILKFHWSNPSMARDILNNNVALLSWDKIKDIACRQFRIKSIGEYFGGTDKQKITIEINKITLGMMHIAKQDNQQEFMYVPVWDFFGEYDDEQSDMLELNRAYSFLTINAINGSIIDRGLGY